MKGKIILFTVMLLSSMVYAQKIDSITPVNLRALAEGMFTNINQTPITTGVLMEKGIVNVDFGDFSGDSAMENTSSNAQFRSAYEQVYYAHLDTTQTGMYTPDSLTNLIRWHNAEKTTAIGLLLFDYNYFNSQADVNSVPYFTMTNNQLFNNPGASGSPYGQATLFIGGPHEASSNARFIIPSNLFFSNKTNFNLVSLLADFNDGSGWQTVLFDQEYPISYSELGEKTIKIKLTANGTAYYCGFEVKVTEAASSAETLYIYDDMWDDPNSTAEAWILYGNGNNSNIMRPVIFVEGFDYLDLFDEDDLFQIMNGGTFYSNIGLVRKLEAQGYDVIILNFLRRGGKSIQSNAEVLRRLIKWVNVEKANNGSTHKNIVGGASMGGVISRYTLAKMEKEYCEDHETELYISYDAPHQGVYLPLSMQYLLAETYYMSFSLISDIRERMQEIRCTAAKQMFTAHIDNNGNALPEHAAFYTELAQLGFPTQTRNIAVSLGNSSSNQPTNSWDGNSYNSGDLIMQITGNGTCTWCTEVNSSSFAVKTTGNSVVATLKADLYYWKWFGARTGSVLFNKSFSYQSSLERDNVSGGYLKTQAEVAYAVNSFLNNSQAANPNSRFWHNLVSTPSAIDFISPQKVSTLNNETETQLVGNYATPFDNVLFDRNNTTSFHAGVLQPNTTTFLYNEIVQNGINTNSKFLNGTIINAAYNFGNHLINEISSVLIGTNGIVNINMSGNTGYGDGPIANSSSFEVKASCGEIIVGNGGQLVIGESASKTATLQASEYSIIRIKSGGSLKVNDGSKVIIEDGANFIFEDGATIELLGNNAELVIEGKVTVGDNATLTFTGTGHMVVDQFIFDGVYDNFWNIGQNAKLELIGSPLRTLLECKGNFVPKMQNQHTFAEIKIKNGIVNMHPNTSISTHAPLDLYMVTMKLASGYQNKHNGLQLWGQNASIVQCTFKNATIGINSEQSLATKPLSLVNCWFLDNEIGLQTRGKNAVVQSSVFNNNTNGGWQALQMSGPSRVENSTFDNPYAYAGIFFEGQQGARLNVTNSVFKNSFTGIESETATLIPECCTFANLTYEGIFAKYSNLYLNEEKYNLFSNNESGVTIINGNGDVFSLENGQNQFLLGNAGINHLNGSFDQGAILNFATSTQLDADNNSMQSISIGNQSGPPVDLTYYPQPFTSVSLTLHIPNNLASISSNCGGNGGIGATLEEELTLQELGTFKTINTTLYPNTNLGTALLDAVGDVSNDITENMDLQAIDKLNEILTYNLGSTTIDEDAMLEIGYKVLIKALNYSFSYGNLQINRAEPNALVDAYTAKVTAVIDYRLGLLNATSNTYNAERFRLNLDKAHVYRIGEYYDKAIEQLSTSTSWAGVPANANRAAYWECICQVERSFLREEISPEDFTMQQQLCQSTWLSKHENAFERRLGQNIGSANSSESLVHVYPNPANEFVTIQWLGSDQGEMDCHILDMQGKILQSSKMPSGTDKISIALPQELVAGIYMIRLSNLNMSETTKLFLVR